MGANRKKDIGKRGRRKEKNGDKPEKEHWKERPTEGKNRKKIEEREETQALKREREQGQEKKNGRKEKHGIVVKKLFIFY